MRAITAFARGRERRRRISEWLVGYNLLQSYVNAIIFSVKNGRGPVSSAGVCVYVCAAGTVDDLSCGPFTARLCMLEEHRCIQCIGISLIKKYDFVVCL